MEAAVKIQQNDNDEEINLEELEHEEHKKKKSKKEKVGFRDRKVNMSMLRYLFLVKNQALIFLAMIH